MKFERVERIREGCDTNRGGQKMFCAGDGKEKETRKGAYA